MSDKYDTIIRKLASIVENQQKQIKKLAQDLANSGKESDLHPGQMWIDINDSGNKKPVSAPPTNLKTPNMATDNKKQAVLNAMSPGLRDAIEDVTVVGDMVHVKFKPGRGTDTEFNSLADVLKKAFPLENMRYTDAPVKF